MIFVVKGIFILLKILMNGVVDMFVFFIGNSEVRIIIVSIKKIIKWLIVVLIVFGIVFFGLFVLFVVILINLVLEKV